MLHALFVLIVLVPALHAFEDDNKKPYLFVDKICFDDSIYDPINNVHTIIIDQISWLENKQHIIRTGLNACNAMRNYVPAAGTQMVLVQFVNTQGMPLIKPFNFDMIYYQESESKIIDTWFIDVTYKAENGSITEEIVEYLK
ncbi:MAG: hypothetical protein WCE21_02265 [Candidatus Babeliales bacterium]